MRKKYNIITIADIHWGSIDPVEHLKALEFIIDFIKNMNDIDLVVIAGDYFDSKLPLNSREALIAIQWMYYLVNVCKESGVSCIRAFQGTLDHDNNQLVAVKNLDVCTWFFKIFINTTLEETLPGLNCIYCPDETIETSEYEFIYTNQILAKKNIGFFHGSFDVVYGELLASKPELMKKQNVVFRYDLWNKVIDGPMIAGHWHDGKQYDNLYYCGSPHRYKFNEDEPKGFIFTQYDIETNEYYVKKIINPLCAIYKTYEIYSNMYNTKEDYKKVVDDIRCIIEDLSNSTLNNKLRIMIYLVDDKPENDVFLSSLRQEINGKDNVKITIKNKLKDKLKKESLKKNKDKQTKFSFIYDKEMHPCKVIQEFIRSTVSEEIPLEFIEDKYKKYFK